MRAIVTGAQGFLGRRTVAALEAAGIDAIPLCRADCDITDPEAVRRFFGENQADVLVHLAALVHGAGRDLSEENYMRVNSEASAELFGCARAHGIRKVIFASSIEVYGEQEARRIDENAICAPNSPYGRSKLAAEQALEAMGEAFESYALLRLAPVYAPDFRLNVDKRFYLPRKIAAYYFRDGGYSFNFCAADNITEFIVDYLEKACPSGIFNISDAANVTAKNFIALERERGGLRRVVKLPYGACYGLIGAAEWLLRRVSRSEPFLSRYNFRKLFKSTVYVSDKARGISPMRHGIEAIYG